MQVAAIRALEPFVIGQPADAVGDIWKRLVHDSQLRWLGPEKGVMHMGIAAVVNALWDLAAKRAGKPLWQLLSEMSPEALVDLVDFRYITDALTPDEALGHPHPRARRQRNSAPSSSGRTATPPTRRRPAGSATPTRSSPASATRRSPPATPRSS